MNFNIQKMIANRKQKMREKRDIKNLSKLEKADRLRTERIELEKKQAIKEYEKEEKKQIRELKYGKYKRFVKRTGSLIGSAIKEAKTEADLKNKRRLSSNMGSSSASRDVFSQGSKIEVGGRNVFSEKEKELKQPTKKIIINT